MWITTDANRADMQHAVKTIEREMRYIAEAETRLRSITAIRKEDEPVRRELEMMFTFWSDLREAVKTLRRGLALEE